MNLEPRYLHCSRGQNVSNNKDNIDYKLFVMQECKGLSDENG